MGQTHEHRQLSGTGWAIAQGDLDRMSAEGWELVAVTAAASQWATYCVSYWKRAVIQ